MKNNIAQKNIPQGWIETTLERECDVLKGQGLSKNKLSEKGKNSCILYGELFTIYREVIKKIKSHTDSTEGIISKLGDILIPASTTTVARDLGIASALNEKDVLLGGDINILRKKRNSYNSNFLAYYLTHYKNKELSGFAQGITIIHLYGKDFKQLDICIPKNIKEQQKIAEILGSVDEYILKTQEVIYDTEKLKKGLMQKLFTQGIGHKKFKKTKLGEIPESWEIKKLSSIGEIITGNTPKTSDKNNYGDEFLFVSPKDIGLLKYINDSEKKLSKKGFSLTRKIPKGSVLMVCIGSTIGKIGIAGCELSTNQQINSVAVENHYSSEYIYYQLLYRRKDVIGRRSTQAVPIINKTDFSLTELAVPKTRSEQEEIAEILSAIDEKISINKKLKSKLIQLKKGLAQDLLSGKVRVQIHE